MFKVKPKPYGEIRDESMELPLIFFSFFERVALEFDDKMHRMGNIIQLYEPGPLPVLEPIPQSCIVQRTTNSLLHGWERPPNYSSSIARSTKINHERAERLSGTGDGSTLMK